MRLALLLALDATFIQPSLAAEALAFAGVRRQVQAASWEENRLRNTDADTDTQDYSGSPINYSSPDQAPQQEQARVDPTMLADPAPVESMAPLHRPFHHPKQVQKSRLDLGRVPPSAGVSLAPAAARPATTEAVRRMPRAGVAQSFRDKVDLIKRDVDAEATRSKVSLEKVSKDILTEVGNVDAEASRTKENLDKITKDIQSEVNKLKYQLRYEHLVNDELQKDLSQALQSKIQLEAQLNQATELVTGATAPGRTSKTVGSSEMVEASPPVAQAAPSMLPMGRKVMMLETPGNDDIPKIPDSRGMEYVMNKLAELEQGKAE